MTDLLGYALVLAALTAGGWALAALMARVYAGERTLLSPVLGPLERGIYRLSGIDPSREQGWASYATAVLALNGAGFALLYAILRLQGALPLNPDGLGSMSPDLAFNTAASFVTNTNWQAYSGEAQATYLAQMAGLTVQNFVSAATGMAVAVAVIRAFARGTGSRVGNAWADVVRSVLYVLLPLSVVVAAILALQGVPQTLLGHATATGLEGAEQAIARGPAATQVAIKQLGTNGGGFFGVNSAHPLENPTIPSNMLQTLAILLIPVAFPFLFGRMVGDRRQGWALFAAMGVLLLAGLAVQWAYETAGNPLLGAGANMEGKEVRFGAALSALWAEFTTAASNGSVNAMHDSFMPLSGLVQMVNMATGEVIFGGVGSGLYGMLLYVVLAVFLAGLMVGRTPEYLGRKIEGREVTLAMAAFLAMPVGILGGTALAVAVPQAAAAVQEAGSPHGFSEALYAYSSGIGNNGSAFGGFGAAQPWHTVGIGLAMLVGRYAVIVPMLALAGSLAAKPRAAATAGTFPTHGPLFVTLLVLTVLILGALTVFPALALGPLAEETARLAGQTF